MNSSTVALRANNQRESPDVTLQFPYNPAARERLLAVYF
jgi:hypothetical protein